jgi:hypothetical protein
MQKAMKQQVNIMDNLEVRDILAKVPLLAPGSPNKWMEELHGSSQTRAPEPNRELQNISDAGGTPTADQVWRDPTARVASQPNDRESQDNADKAGTQSRYTEPENFDISRSASGGIVASFAEKALPLEERFLPIFSYRASNAFKGGLIGLGAGAATIGIDHMLRAEFGESFGGHDLFRPTSNELWGMGIAAAAPLNTKVRLGIVAASWFTGRAENYFWH